MPANDTQIGGDHYRKHKIQPWDVYEEWLGRDGFVGNLRGNILSYLIRYKDKGGVKDLLKARHDLDKLIELESEFETPKNTQGPEVQNTPCRTYPDRCTCNENRLPQQRSLCPVHPLFPGIAPKQTLRCACYNYGIIQPGCSIHGAQAVKELNIPSTLRVAFDTGEDLAMN